MSQVDFLSKAEADARNAVIYFKDEIIYNILNGKDEIFIDQYGAQWHTENHMHRSYRFLEAASLIEQLEEYEEPSLVSYDGSGTIIPVVQDAAQCTYANAVASMFTEILKRIFNDEDVQNLATEYNQLEQYGGKDERRLLKDLEVRVETLTKIWSSD